MTTSFVGSEDHPVLREELHSIQQCGAIALRDGYGMQAWVPCAITFATATLSKKTTVAVAVSLGRQVQEHTTGWHRAPARSGWRCRHRPPIRPRSRTVPGCRCTRWSSSPSRGASSWWRSAVTIRSSGSVRRLLWWCAVRPPAMSGRPAMRVVSMLGDCVHVQVYATRRANCWTFIFTKRLWLWYKISV